LFLYALGCVVGLFIATLKKMVSLKLPLGHHRDDLITTLLMSIMYNGEIRSNASKNFLVIIKNIYYSPASYCQEKDIIKYFQSSSFLLFLVRCAAPKKTDSQKN